jgi:ribosomal protein L40E
VVCLECGTRLPDAAQRCRSCGVYFGDRPAKRPSDAHQWEYSELVVTLPGLRWFQFPTVWLPLIEEQIARVRQDGWQTAYEINVPSLVAFGCFRRGTAPTDRAAHADSVVLTLKRQHRSSGEIERPRVSRLSRS